MGLHDLLTSAPPRVDLVVADGRRLSSAEIDAAAGSTAAGLRERGVGRGDPVAFQVPNGPDAVVLYRACWRLGAIAAPPTRPLSTRHNPLELQCVGGCNFNTRSFARHLRVTPLF